MFTSPYRPDNFWGVTERPVQWVPGALFPGLRRQGREAELSPPTSVEVKKIYIYKLYIHSLVKVLGYRSGGPGSIPGHYKKKVMGLERGPLSLMSTTEELLDRKVAAPV
jgi:hypothetical protein